MERTKYSTIYLGELTQMIKDCQIAAIRDAYAQFGTDSGSYALKHQVGGIFNVTDRILAALYTDKDEEEEI